MRERRLTRSRSRAFTLVELVFVVAIVALLISVAMPSFEESKRKQIIAQCESQIVVLSQRLEKYKGINYGYPNSLAELGAEEEDCYGNPFQYLNLDNFDDKGMYTGPADAKGPTKPRKDKNLKPLNTDFDLFSMGADGEYKDTLSAKVSRDDIIRANDGTFIGFADDY